MQQLNDDVCCADISTWNFGLADGFRDVLSEDTTDDFSTASLSSHPGPGGRGTPTNTCDSDSDMRIELPSCSTQQRRKRKPNHFNSACISTSSASSRQTKLVSPSSPSRSCNRDGRHPHVIRIRNHTGLSHQRARNNGRSFVASDSGLDGDQYADDEEEEEEESPSPLFTPASQSFEQIIAGANRDNSLKPFLQIVEQPEKCYRARYACEGCRGPIKGRTPETAGASTFPTVKVMNYCGTAMMTVHLVTVSGDPHYHIIVPGSSQSSKAQTITADSIPALQLTITPEDDMKAIWDNLSIRRLRRWEGDRKLRNRGVDPATWQKERVQAALMFQASIFTPEGVKLIKVMSEPIQCTSPQGSPEISWISHESGGVNGGNEIGLIGLRFNRGFKVRFYSEDWEMNANVDRNKSNTGGAVVIVPSYKDQGIMEPVKVCIEVKIGPDRNPICSDPVEYTYLPLVELSEVVTQQVPCPQSRDRSPSSLSSSPHVYSTEQPQSSPISYSNFFDTYLSTSPGVSPSSLNHSGSSSMPATTHSSPNPTTGTSYLCEYQQVTNPPMNDQHTFSSHLLCPSKQPQQMLKQELQSSPVCSQVDQTAVGYPSLLEMSGLMSQGQVMNMNYDDDHMYDDDDMLNCINLDSLTPTEEANSLPLHFMQTSQSQQSYHPPQSAISLSQLLANHTGGMQENTNVSTLDVLTLLARRGLLKMD